MSEQLRRGPTCGYCDDLAVAEHATAGPPSRWLPVCHRHAASHDSDLCTQDQRCGCLCGACDEYCCSKDARVSVCRECGGTGGCGYCYEGLIVDEGPQPTW